MFSRNILFTVELAHSCKHPLLQSGWPSRVGHVRGELRNSFHNSRRQIRRPALEPDPLLNIPCDLGPLCSKNLYRPFLFTVGLSTASIIGCAVWEYETLRTHASAFIRRPASWFNTQQKRVLAHSKSESGPISKWWKSLRDSEKVFYPILGLNVLVFGMWRVRSLQPFMVKYFCSNPAARTVCVPMLLSTFSHYSAMHLAANMYVLYSFMPAAIAALGKEQFVTMYLSAGVISSFASFVFKVVMNQPGLSLGASGAIMAVLSFVCVHYPDTKLSIIFLPMYTFAAGTAIKAIMGVDLAGVVFGWKFFDHAAHLGGALFGIVWHQWGSSHIWGNRDYFLQYYHAIRKTDSR